MSENIIARKRCPSCWTAKRLGCPMCEFTGEVAACVVCDGSGLSASKLAPLSVLPCSSCASTGIGDPKARRFLLDKREAARRRAASAPPQQQKAKEGKK